MVDHLIKTNNTGTHHQWWATHGKAKRHTVDKSSKKKARESAEHDKNSSEKAVKSKKGEKGKPHYHPADKKGKKVKNSTHYTYPEK